MVFCTTGGTGTIGFVGLEEIEKLRCFCAIGAKKISVEFNKAVDADEAVFAVKRGTVSVNIAEVKLADDNKSAVLELSTKLIKGDYTVTVTGVADEALIGTVEGIQNEVATTIEIVSNEAASVRVLGVIQEAIISYKVLNQYGEDITSIAPPINWNSSVGTATRVGSTKTVKIEVTGTQYLTIGQPVTVTAVMTSPGLVATKQIAIGDPATVTTVEFDGLYHATDRELNTAANYGEFSVLFEAKDQYGNKLDLTHLNNELVVTSTNPGIVKVLDEEVKASLGEDSDQFGLVLEAPVTKIDGSANIRMISKTTGKAFEFTVVVAKAAQIDTFTLLQPEKTIAVNEVVEIPFEAYDQFGNLVTSHARLDNDITFLAEGGSSLDWKNDYVNKKGVLEYTAPVTKGSYILMVSTPTGKVSQLTVEVVDAAEAAVVTGTKNVVTNVAIGGSFEIKRANLDVIDQWGRAYGLTDKLVATAEAGTVDKYRVVATKAASDDRVSLSGAITTNTSAITVTGLKKGTSIVTLTVEKVVDLGDGESPRYVFEPVAGSELALRVTIADMADLVSFEIKELPTILDVDHLDVAGLDAPGIAALKAKYEVALTVYGVTANGTKVVLPSSAYEVVTNSDKFVHVGGKLSSDELAGFTASRTELKRNVIVTVLSADPQILTSEVTISSVAPVITTVALSTTHANYEKANLVSISAAGLDFAALETLVEKILVAKDQYGVELVNDEYTIILSNFSKNAGVTATLKDYNSAPATTLVEGNTVTVTAISNTGIVNTFTVVVVE